MYRSLNEFEIRPDETTGFHGNRVTVGKTRTFLIVLFSYLQLMMIYIRA